MSASEPQLSSASKSSYNGGDLKERSEQKPARKGDSELSPKEYSQKLAKRDRMTLFILGGDSLDIDRPLTAEEETELLSGRTFYDAIPDLIKEYKTR